MAAEVGEEEAGEVLGRVVEIDAGAQAFVGEVLGERGPDDRQQDRARLLELLEQRLGFGREDLLQQLVIVDGTMAHDEGLGDAVLDAVLGQHRFAETEQEVAHLPGDGLGDDLIPSAREVAVDVARETPGAVATSSRLVLASPHCSTQVSVASRMRMRVLM